MILHNFLAISNVCFFSLFSQAPFSYPFTQAAYLCSFCIRCPVSAKFSFRVCLRNFYCLFPIVSKSQHLLMKRSVFAIDNIMYNQISVASSFLFICKEMVHHSLPYRGVLILPRVFPSSVTTLPRHLNCCTRLILVSQICNFNVGLFLLLTIAIVV